MTVTKAAFDARTTTQDLEVKLDSKTAATTDTQIVGTAPFAGVVSLAEVVLHAAVTGDNTNTRTFTLQNRGQAGAGTTSVATLALTTGNDVSAFDAKAMTLSGTPANLVVTTGDVLALQQTVGASGLAHSGGQARVRLTRS